MTRNHKTDWTMGSGGVGEDSLLDRLFENAAWSSDPRALDRLMDYMAASVHFDGGTHDQRLGQLDHSLDSMGAMFRRRAEIARQMGQPAAAQMLRRADQLIQRLRSGVLANVDKYDGLRGPLGYMKSEDIVEYASSLADSMDMFGLGSLASVLRQARNQLSQSWWPTDPIFEPPYHGMANASELYPGDGPHVGNPNLRRLSADFEQTSRLGLVDAQDALLDRLADKVGFSKDHGGRRLKRMEKHLDKLGAYMRRKGRKTGSDGLERDHDLIGRLRSGVLALANERDGLHTALGSMPPSELTSRGLDLAARLRRKGHVQFAQTVEQVVHALADGLLRKRPTEAFEAPLDDGPFGYY